MKTKISVVFLVVSLFLTAVPFSFAQTSQNDWSAVEKLAVGTDLLIKTSKGKTVKGSLAAVSDSEVELFVEGNRSVLPKNNIKAIYYAVPKTGKRATLIGAAVGAVVVLSAVGAASGDDGDSGTGSAIFPFLTGIVGGAFVGGLFGNGKKKGALIYKTK